MEKTVRAAAYACLCLALGCASATLGIAQESRMPVDEEGKVVDFERDIAPIFAEHCYECHSGDEAKAGFRVDERDTVLGYVEPEDVHSSMMYVDYLVSEDDTMLMPPRSHGGPLSPAQLALVRLWIEEGAEWPEGAALPVQPEAAPVPAEVAQPVANEALWTRIWAFQGYFHPAMVHFPIALLTIGGLFVLLGVKWPKLGTQVPMTCLILGSISAVAASLMGWSFAYEQGYPGYEAGWSHDINSHRWSGTIVALAAVVLAVIAVAAVSSQNKALNRVWKSGLFALALTVGLVGHQGGELTYGKSFYSRALQRLWGSETVEAVEEAVESAIDDAATEIDGVTE